MKKMKALDYNLLFELIKNPKRSDRELSKILHVSQPTITRKRTNLEKNRIISYTGIPDLDKIGIEIVAITLLSVKPEDRKPKELGEKHEDWANHADNFFSKHPNIVLSTSGRGSDQNAAIISLHKDYSSLVDFLRDIEINFGKHLTKIETFRISVRSDRIRRLFAFQQLGQYLQKNI